MRLKQRNLHAPVTKYSKLINGKLATLELYTEPTFCVNVIQNKGSQIVKHCYPVSEQMFYDYMREAEIIKNRTIEVIEMQVHRCCNEAWKHKGDINLFTFWTNAAKSYLNRPGIDVSGVKSIKELEDRIWTS